MPHEHHDTVAESNTETMGPNAAQARESRAFHHAAHILDARQMIDFHFGHHKAVFRNVAFGNQIHSQGTHSTHAALLHLADDVQERETPARQGREQERCSCRLAGCRKRLALGGEASLLPPGAVPERPNATPGMLHVVLHTGRAPELMPGPPATWGNRVETFTRLNKQAALYQAPVGLAVPPDTDGTLLAALPARGGQPGMVARLRWDHGPDAAPTLSPWCSGAYTELGTDPATGNILALRQQPVDASRPGAHALPCLDILSSDGVLLTAHELYAPELGNVHATFRMHAHGGHLILNDTITARLLRYSLDGTALTLVGECAGFGFEKISDILATSEQTDGQDGETDNERLLLPIWRLDTILSAAPDLSDIRLIQRRDLFRCRNIVPAPKTGPDADQGKPPLLAFRFEEANHVLTMHRCDADLRFQSSIPLGVVTPTTVRMLRIGDRSLAAVGNRFGLLLVDPA